MAMKLPTPLQAASCRGERGMPLAHAAVVEGQLGELGEAGQDTLGHVELDGLVLEGEDFKAQEVRQEGHVDDARGWYVEVAQLAGKAQEVVWIRPVARMNTRKVRSRSTSMIGVPALRARGVRASGRVKVSSTT